MLIDARGKACPGPVMMADEALSRMQEGIVEVIVDNEEASLNLRGYAAQHGMASDASREGTDWKVRIVKGYVCQPGSTSGVRGPELTAKLRGLMLIVGTDTLGKDEELGKMLMKGFFETMKVHRQAPHTLFLLNAGVRLTTTNADTVPVLKEIEAMGTEIYSCGTCLKHYGLEKELKVGKRGTTNHIIEGMQDFEKVVWI
ncbi:MAG: sulfurtransferase-like selenium metabolism protein YedF [Nitrospiraceae bacterium]|nr:sulfurtransferase-like selenium metabolism protein YedF [Nitrospiraceae bacterium]